MTHGLRTFCSTALFALVCLTTSTAAAQHRVDVHARSHAVSFRDVVASDLPYDGLTAAGDLGYHWRGDRLSTGVELGLQHGTLSSATSDALVLARTTARLDAELSFRLTPVGRWRVDVGPALENTLGTHAFESGGFVQYTGHFMLGGMARVSRDAGPHTFAARLTTPLVGYLIRPPYAMESNELWRDGSVGGILGSGTFSSVHNLRRVGLAGSWRWRTWKRFSFGLGAGWRMQQITTPRPYLESDFSLSLFASLHPGRSR